MSVYKQKPELIGFGNRIAEKRAERGMKQEELAAKIGIGRPALSKIESGAQDVKIETLAAISKVLNTSADYFLHGASANNIDVFMQTGLEDSSLAQLSKWKEIDEAFCDDGVPPRIDVINEILSDVEFYNLANSFTRFRREWGRVITEITELEKVKKEAEIYSKERREAAERINELNERAAFLKWKFTQKTAVFIDKLLEVK